MPGGKAWTTPLPLGLEQLKPQVWGGKYRKVEQGEWNLFQTEDRANEATVDSHTDGQTDGQTDGTQTLPSPHRLPALDTPLPWDHIDTGISKQWLKDDLIRALDAATVADCAFEGCSHCGVCGTDLGHNVVVPPPPLPDFDGQFVPNQHRQQRLRGSDW